MISAIKTLKKLLFGKPSINIETFDPKPLKSDTFVMLPELLVYCIDNDMGVMLYRGALVLGEPRKVQVTDSMSRWVQPVSFDESLIPDEKTFREMQENPPEGYIRIPAVDLYIDVSDMEIPIHITETARHRLDFISHPHEDGHIIKANEPVVIDLDDWKDHIIGPISDERMKLQELHQAEYKKILKEEKKRKGED